MKVSWRRKSWWERALDPIARNVKGRALKVNGKALNDGAAKPAVRAVGVLATATAVSAIVSALRRQDSQ
jgi:hypothetical protein